MSIKADRLRQAREKAGYPSATAAAQAFGWTESAYRHHENGTRRFDPDAARRYGRAFKVKPAWLLAMDDDPSPKSLPSDAGSDVLTVNASVAAGVWREAQAWDDERRFEMIVDSLVPTGRRFGLLVEGHSMDRYYEPGTVLDCVSIYAGSVEPRNGDHVIVQRRRPDGLRELTVKEYLEEDGRFYLVPRSSRSEFSDRIEIGAPDCAHEGDDAVEVVGFVVTAYPPRALELLRRMNLIRRSL